jgi:hypothetical protein
VSVVVWFWGHQPHVVKRIYPLYPEREAERQAERHAQAERDAERHAGQEAERQAEQAERAKRAERQNFIWDAQFARLEAYKAVQADCNVPRRWVDKTLVLWVRNQREAKKKFDRDGSGTTAARVERLTALGFAWAPDDILWDAQFARLEAYKVVHGDCNVPRRSVENPALVNWVRNQREAKKKFDLDGSVTTAARVARLAALGFVWAPWRGSKRKVWSTLSKPETPRRQVAASPAAQGLRGPRRNSRPRLLLEPRPRSRPRPARAGARLTVEPRPRNSREFGGNSREFEAAAPSRAALPEPPAPGARGGAAHSRATPPKFEGTWREFERIRGHGSVSSRAPRAARGPDRFDLLTQFSIFYSDCRRHSYEGLALRVSFLKCFQNVNSGCARQLQLLAPPT